MPICKNDDNKKYTGREKSPQGRGWCAAAEKLGRKRIGKDKKIWEIVKKWQKVKVKTSYSSSSSRRSSLSLSSLSSLSSPSSLKKSKKKRKKRKKRKKKKTKKKKQLILKALIIQKQIKSKYQDM